MHEKLWAGAELKLEYASFHLERMIQALQPPERTTWTVALEASGASVANDWQRFLYPHFDAFLPCVRSVPDIINWNFGKDNRALFVEWFKKLPQDEQDCRTIFYANLKKSALVLINIL